MTPTEMSLEAARALEGINQDQVDRQRALLDLKDEDLRRLEGLRSWAEESSVELIEQFYEVMLNHPDTSTFLESDDLVERLKEQQREYLLGLFTGRCDARYARDRVRVGRVHERIGLAPRLYLAAYQRYVNLVVARLAEERPDEVLEVSRSLQKLVCMDSILALEAYIGRVTERLLEEQRAAKEVAENSQAVAALLTALGRATSSGDALRLALDAVRESFGWTYGSFWEHDVAGDVLRFGLESGSIGEEFREITREASFARGVGVSGRTLARGDLLVVEDLGQVSDCVRAPAAVRANLKSGVCFPVRVAGRILGTMDFFATQELPLSEARQETLRNVARLVGTQLERLEEQEFRAEEAANTAAVNHVLRALSGAVNTDEAASRALDTVRAAFGWAYGSYWVKDDKLKALKFSVESGDISPAFRQTTQGATFPKGIGVSGRTWDLRDLVFVEDLGQVSDCVRAPVAVQAGIKSGVCFPIIVEDEVVGTMDFFALERITLSTSRQGALRNVAQLVSTSLQRLHERERSRDLLSTYLERLGSIAAGLQGAVQTQNRTAQALASAVAEVTATLSELRETSAQTLDRAQRVIEEAAASVSTSEEGERSVEEAADSMRSISQQVEEISERILSLNTQTMQIGDIVASVNEIASQSKLLALNAAIEAARAGRRGDGFAVVAGEIRSLSEQSREATHQIKQILNEIQDGTNQAVVSAEQGTKRVGAGVTLAERSGTNIRQLALALETSSESARLIANSARQQNAGIEEVASAMVNIRESADSTADGLTQTQEVTRQLGLLTNEMSSVLDQDH